MIHVDDLEAKRKGTLDEYNTTTEKYMESVVIQAEAKFEYIKLLAKQIMKNPKIAIEKIISQSLVDTSFEHRIKFSENYHNFEYNKALCKGLEQRIAYLQSELSTMQSWMRYVRDNG